MQKGIITMYKQIGETPLECLKRARILHHIHDSLPMTYAGRLDPMAEGLLIILVGEECKNKQKYLNLDKTYEFEILAGFSTDTYDLLGKVTSPEIVFERSSDLLSDFQSAGQTVPKTISGFVPTLTSFVGTFTQSYPAFSSKTVDGNQLFQLAKDDQLPGGLPEHEVTIYKLQCTNTIILKKEVLHKEILQRIAKVAGDFRQIEIIKIWDEVFEKIKQKEFQILSCVVECSSGTYIRQLVDDISDRIDLPLVTYSIKRTRVGDYKLEDITT